MYVSISLSPLKPKYTYPIEGAQNRSRQNMLLWHNDYFEFKAIETHPEDSGKALCHPTTALRDLDKEPSPGRELTPYIDIYIRI